MGPRENTRLILPFVAVLYDPKEIAVERMVEALTRAGTYRGAAKGRPGSDPRMWK